MIRSKFVYLSEIYICVISIYHTTSDIQNLPITRLFYKLYAGNINEFNIEWLIKDCSSGYDVWILKF
jgi:hypothetical protein